MPTLPLQRTQTWRCQKSHAIVAQSQTFSMIYIITVASAARKVSIFVLTATGLVEGVITGLALAGWLGRSTSVPSHRKDIQRITNSRTSCQRGDTHDQALQANHTTLKKVLSAKDATRLPTPATGTATSVSKEPGDTALHASIRDSTAHIHFFQLVAKA